jgi:starvation-inducible outer membrane lipoprotein
MMERKIDNKKGVVRQEPWRYLVMSAVRCKNWEIESLVLGGLAYQLI